MSLFGFQLIVCVLVFCMTSMYSVISRILSVFLVDLVEERLLLIILIILVHLRAPGL